MAKKRKRSTVANVRRGLMISLVAFLGVVVGLYVVGRMGRPSSVRTATEQEQEIEPEKRSELVLSGKGFDYGLTQGDREVFHIRASRILSDKNNNFELEGVELEMEREDGTHYKLTSDHAIYNLDSQEASFDGNVHFFGPSDVELTAEGLELREEGEVIVSSSAVQFEFVGRFVGTANRLRVSPRRDLFVLAGEVFVSSKEGAAEPMALECRRFSYERDDRRLRAEGNVVLRRGNDSLQARRLLVTLSSDEERIETLRARWDVSGEVEQFTDDGQIAKIEVSGRELAVDFESGLERPRKGELEAGGGAPAVLAIRDESGLKRRIEGDQLVAIFAEGDLRRAEAFGNVEISEFLEFSPEPLLRKACAEQAVAVVSPSGELRTVDLDRMVQLHDRGVQAFGDKARVDMRVGKMQLHGDPAWVVRAREEMQAPTIVYDQDLGEITAEDTVNARLASGQGFDLSGDSAADGQPILLQAERAVWAEEASSVSFAGKVRAWQGENFLVADELVGEVESSRLTAKGKVKTVWRPEPDEASDVDDSLAREPLEVTAEEMEYRRDENVLVYSGNARAVQLQRTLLCEEIRVFLAEGGGFQEMICSGSIEMDDRESGNTVTGDKAIYRPEERIVRIEGSPVVLKDSKGTELQGRVLIYDLDSATARLQSERPREDEGGTR